MKHVLCRTVSFTWGLLMALIKALMNGKMFCVYIINQANETCFVSHTKFHLLLHTSNLDLH